MLIIIVTVNLWTGRPGSPVEVLSSVFCLQWYGISVPNCGHLWYISCILFCYLITPLLQHVSGFISGKSFKWYFLQFMTLAVVMQILYSFHAINQAPYMVIPYVAGYFWSGLKMENILPQRPVTCLAMFLTSFFIVLAILEETLGIEIPSPVLIWYKTPFALAVVWLCNQRSSCTNITSVEKKLFDFTDRYSYTIYLAHHIFILGPLSLIRGRQDHILLYTMISLVLAVTAGVALYKVDIFLRKIIRRRTAV